MVGAVELGVSGGGISLLVDAVSPISAPMGFRREGRREGRDLGTAHRMCLPSTEGRYS